MAAGAGTWTPPLSLLGRAESVLPPARAAIRVASALDVSAYAGGLVLVAGSFNLDSRGRVLPVLGGLYDEDTFGPLPRLGNGGVDLDAYEAESFSKRPQLGRFGELPLLAPIVHPWIRRHASFLLREATALDAASIDGIFAGSLCVHRSGDVHPVASVQDQPMASNWFVGAMALKRVAAIRKQPFVDLYRRVPVLPAGLRPARLVAERILVHDATVLYGRVLHANDDLDDATQSGTVGSHARAIAGLQRAIESLFFDGLDSNFDPIDPNLPDAASRCVVLPLLVGIRGRDGRFGTNCLTELATVTDAKSLVMVLRGPLFIFRAMLEASCLEVVPLHANREIDRQAVEVSRRDRAANAIADVYEWQLGPLWPLGPLGPLGDGQVLHGPQSSPHVDVMSYQTSPTRDSALIITAGASTEAMIAALPSNAHPYFELLCEVPPEIDPQTRIHLMRRLLELARYPFQQKTFFAHGHDVKCSAPILPGSTLIAWVLFELDADWTNRLSDAMPHHPVFLTAVAVTEDQLNLKAERGADALRELLNQSGRGFVTNPA